MNKNLQQRKLSGFLTILLYKLCYDLKEVHDPIVGQKKKRIIEKKSNCIVVKMSEVSQLVNSAYHETNSEGAKKLNRQMSHTYCGLSRRIIQRNLNSMKQQQKVRPFFIIRRLSDQSKQLKYKKGIKWILLVWSACQVI